MKQAIIIYHSRTGTTKTYAEAIGEYLHKKGFDILVTSTIGFREEMLMVPIPFSSAVGLVD